MCLEKGWKWEYWCGIMGKNIMIRGDIVQPLFTSMKVNNEIELCEVTEQDCKQAIERALLQNSISFYIRWPKTSIFRFSKAKDTCIICVNGIMKDEAESVVRTLCDEAGYTVRFLMKKSHNDYL